MKLLSVTLVLATVALAAGSASAATQALHSDGERVLDHRGREVILRGFHHIALRSNRTRPADPHAPAAQLFELGDIDRDDFRTIAAMGLNSVRLPITWEFAQPDAPPAPYNLAYLRLLDRAIRNARAAGIMVILDLAQFGYGRSVDGNAGAPAWTVREECMRLPANPFGPPQGSPRVHCAFTDFWTDVGGIQTQYFALWHFLAQRYASVPGIALFDLFNEPIGGFIPPGSWEREYLYPFYRRLAAAIREADPDRTVGFQPFILHSAGVSPPYIEPIAIDNAVYTAHNYTAGFVSQQATPAYLPGQSWITREDFRATADEARRFGSPFLNGETGWVKCTGDTSFDNRGPASCDDAAPLQFAADMTAVADEIRVGWHWSEYSSDPADEIRAVNQRGKLDVPLVKALARPFPQATAGRVVSMRFDADTRVYHQRTKDLIRGRSEIAVPVKWTYPMGACIRVGGRLVAALTGSGRLRTAARGVRFHRSRQVLILPDVGPDLRISPGRQCGSK